MAYPNKLIIEGLRDTYRADPDNAAIGIWLRCDLAAEATNPDGTPALVLASASTRGVVVTMQPIAAGAYGVCQLSNGGGGSLMGVCVGSIPAGSPVCAAASGKVAATGGVVLGVATCAGFDGGTVTYIPNPAAA